MLLSDLRSWKLPENFFEAVLTIQSSFNPRFNFFISLLSFCQNDADILTKWVTSPFCCAWWFLQVGSIFEYFNQNPLFGVVQPDNPLWAPILGVFAVTGFPSAVSTI